MYYDMNCFCFVFLRMSVDLLQFLVTVDGTKKFVARAVEALAKNDITEVYELRGADADVIRKHVGQMTGGLHAFIDTACDKYKTYGKAQKAEKDNGIIATRISAVEEALGYSSWQDPTSNK